MWLTAGALIAVLSAPSFAAEEPLTVGAVARGILNPQAPGVHDRWRAALRDPRPEVRAAAARAVTNTAVGMLGPDVLEALGVEKDRSVAMELARAAVVLHPKARDLEMVSRVRNNQEATALARAFLRVRPASAREHLPALLKAGFGPSARDAEMLLLSEPGLPEALARQALETSNAELWSAVLEFEGLERPLLDAGLLVQGLGSSNDQVRGETVAYLVERAGKPEQIPPAVRAAFEGSTPSTEVPLREAVRRELLRRALGAAPRRAPGWSDLTAEATIEAYRDLLWPPTLGLFTREERESLSGAMGGPSDRLEGRLKSGGRDRRTGDEAENTVWTLSDLPVGYQRGVLEATGCRLENETVGGAEVLFRPDGRPQRITLTSDPLSEACKEAVTLLAASIVWPFDRIPNAPVLVLVFLEPEFVTCGEQSHTYRASPARIGWGGIKEPKRTRNVLPTYPQVAKERGLQGAVRVEALISPSGCISSMRLLGSPGRSLTWAAFRAVSKWRYTPTLLDGHPVPVTMTVTVNFRLGR
jgi:TonB family protein